MGLDVSHDAFHGAYSAFNRLRKAVAKAAGGSFPPHDDDYRLDDGAFPEPGFWYVEDDITDETHPGLYEFLGHSDCDGIITPEKAELVADDLEALLPAVRRQGCDWGHIKAQGGFGPVLEQFIAGCRRAAEVGEDLEFY